MTAASPPLHYSYEEYASFEEHAHERHEYVSGLILAMAGGSLEHSALCSAVIVALAAQLSGRRCRVYDSNARVRVKSSGNAYYPDASVVCGSLETDPGDERSMLNPSVLVEVLSPTTEEYDRADKLADYRSIPSLRHIVHVAHDQKRIDVWTREGAGWSTQSFPEGTIAPLQAIDGALDVSQLYRDPLD